MTDTSTLRERIAVALSQAIYRQTEGEWQPNIRQAGELAGIVLDAQTEQPAPEAAPTDNTALLAEVKRLRPHYQSGTSTDIARRQLLDHFEAFAIRDAQPAPDAVAEAAWSGVENAPYDTPLTVLAGGMTFAAILRRDASLNEDGESCDQWQAVVEGEHPPCWTDGACWESNEDGISCLWPEAFMPLTHPGDLLSIAKGPRP